MKHRIFTKLLATILLAESVLQFVEPLHVHAAGDLRIEDYFPDAGFQAVLRQKYDTNHDGYLSSEERGVYNIYCEHEPSVRSLEGIEFFPEVRGIWCRDCNITSLDLRNNPEVTGVWCSENPITYLNLTENDKLEWVYCFKCELQTLNVSENPLLAYLECSDNPLTSIDLSNNKDLEHLIISSTQLSSLDVSNNRKLSHLDALKIGLTTLDLGNNPNMKRLDVWDNPGLDVDISGLSGLEFYNCANNDLTHLDVSHNPELMALYCDWNDIPSLDLSNNPRLVDLRCGCNLLHSLDLSHNPQLSYCQVFGNPLSELNISNNSRLKYVMEQADNGSIAKVYDGNSQSYDMLVEWGGSHEYMDWMQYFISIPTSTTIRMNAATREDVKDVYINTNDGLSGSEDFVTRGEAIQTLYEMAGRPNTGGSTRFTDVDGTFYADAVRWGEKNHICQGYPFIHSDEFGGDKPIARQDLALMVHRYAEYKGYLSAFDYGRTDNMDDFFDVDYYAWGAMTYAVQWKVVPTKGNHIYPHGRITTSELNQGLIEFLDHVNVGGSARVSTAGGSGTLTAEDKESRGYVNHTVDVGGGNGSGNQGNGNSGNGSGNNGNDSGSGNDNLVQEITLYPTDVVKLADGVDGIYRAVVDNGVVKSFYVDVDDDGKADSGINGIVEIKGSDGNKYHFVIKNGAWDPTFNSVNDARTQVTPYSITVNGEVWQYIVEGGVILEGAEGIIKSAQNKQYFVSQGRVCDYYTGLAWAEGDPNKYYVENGICDITKGGVIAVTDTDGVTNSWLIALGRVVVEFSGITSDANGWYLVYCGQLLPSWTGTANCNGISYRVLSGRITSPRSVDISRLNGILEFLGGNYTIVNGEIIQ